jgi:hypothetical protein
MEAGHKRKRQYKRDAECRHGIKDKYRAREIEAGHKRKRHGNRDTDTA